MHENGISGVLEPCYFFSLSLFGVETTMKTNVCAIAMITTITMNTLIIISTLNLTLRL